jgi:streptomycin 6-kinase
VDQANGTPAALKVLRPGETEERAGFDLLQAWAGQGAVQVYARSDTAILMEFCPGPSLGDMVREGFDHLAMVCISDVARALSAAPLPNLHPLDARMAPLLQVAPSDPLHAAATLAKTLLATSSTIAALHGDLHHDNIIQSTRGWLVIDPKGVRGDPAYDCANAFRNPEGAGDLIFQPSRIHAMADCFADLLCHDRRRILGWAAAHCALSIIWFRESGQDASDDQRLLPILLAAAAV